MLFRLHDKLFMFPNPRLAEADGLLAVGGGLEPERLIAAYRAGIFPWFNEPPCLWWSPDPRAVIVPESLHIPRRLSRSVRKARFRLSTNTAFAQVCHACATSPRTRDLDDQAPQDELHRIEAKGNAAQNASGEPKESAEPKGNAKHDARAAQNAKHSSWISPDMQTAYQALHAMGIAHSVELWQDEQLVGGLYGILLGRIFCGESMFHHVADASKAAFAWFAQRFFSAGGVLIDCQQMSPHMIRFGAVAMPRADFLAHLAAADLPLAADIFSCFEPSALENKIV